jgi:hypothetical protein
MLAHSKSYTITTVVVNNRLAAVGRFSTRRGRS